VRHANGNLPTPWSYHATFRSCTGCWFGSHICGPACRSLPMPGNVRLVHGCQLAVKLCGCAAPFVCEGVHPWAMLCIFRCALHETSGEGRPQLEGSDVECLGRLLTVGRCQQPLLTAKPQPQGLCRRIRSVASGCTITVSWLTKPGFRDEVDRKPLADVVHAT
jgi:hypothetical protein